VEAYFSNFAYAYLASTLFQVLPLLAKAKFTKIISTIFSNSKIRDSCKFVLFIALFNSIYKAVLCATRRIFKDDRKCAPIAGLLSGTALMLDVKARRQFLGAAALGRVIDTGFNLAEEKEVIPKIGKKECIMFIVATAYCNYLLGCQK